jgi:cation:H+ antiporter
MVIGISAILVPITISKSLVKKETIIMIGIALLLIALSADGIISKYEGVLLVASLIIFTVFIYNNAKQRNQANSEFSERKPQTFFWKELGFIGIGIVLLYVGAIFTVDNALIIVESLGVSELIIGITTIAIGTSLPELVTSVIAIKKRHHDIGVGNIIGSNVYNILMIIGVSATLVEITVNRVVFIDYLVMIGFSLAMLITIKTGKISRSMGLGLVAALIVYLGTLFLR